MNSTSSLEHLRDIATYTHSPAWMSAQGCLSCMQLSTNKDMDSYKNEIWTQFAACSIYNWHEVKMTKLLNMNTGHLES